MTLATHYATRAGGGDAAAPRRDCDLPGARAHQAEQARASRLVAGTELASLRIHPRLYACAAARAPAATMNASLGLTYVTSLCGCVVWARFGFGIGQVLLCVGVSSCNSQYAGR